MLKKYRNIKIKYLAGIVAATVLIITGGFALLFYSAVKIGVINPEYIWFDEPSFLFSIYGEGEAALIEPVAVDAAPDGTIFVADVGARDIKVFDNRGRYMYKFNSMDKQGQLLAPVGVAVSGEVVYVTDSMHNQVFKFDLNVIRTALILTSEEGYILLTAPITGFRSINSEKRRGQFSFYALLSLVLVIPNSSNRPSQGFPVTTLIVFRFG